ncbi:MAG: preprotein translocase subunit SecE [Phycisphaerae bacterium]|nr:preprotein translocase subunit SecE [Phycisphaerae bacterium]
MAMGIYKHSEGYWLRVLTAGAIGMIALATAAWAWSQGALLAEKLPRPSWELTLRAAKGAAPLEAPLTLLGGSRSDQMEPIGAAKVVSYDAAQSTVVIHDIGMNAGSVVSDVKRVRIGGGKDASGADLPASFNADVTNRNAQALIEPKYVQGGLAGVIMVVGGVLAFWFTGVSRRAVDFLIATDYEMRKVNWSTRREVTGSTWVVVGASVLIALFIFAFDFLFSQFFQRIGVLVH